MHFRLLADCVPCVAELQYILLSRILDTSSYFFFEGPLEYAIDASLDWIAASSLQASRVKKLGPFRLTSALLNSGVNSLLLSPPAALLPTH